MQWKELYDKAAEKLAPRAVSPFIEAGGVAAAGYAGRKGKLASGTDILSSLNGLGEPDVLLVGGIFGVLGFLIHYCIGLLPVIGSAGPATTDLPGITVFILAVVTRLAFGKTGLTGKYTGSGKREWFATGKGFIYNVVLGGGIGNLIDRIATGVVVDYINVLFMNFAIFNFADICVCVGVGLLMVWVLFDSYFKEKAEKSVKTESAAPADDANGKN